MELMLECSGEGCSRIYHSSRSDDSFVNEWGEETFVFECPHGEALTRVHAAHHNELEARRWSFGCSSISGVALGTSCWWSTGAGGGEWTIGDAGMIITGIASYSGGSTARYIWTVRVCPLGNMSGWIHSDDYASDVGETINYTARESHFISQVHSSPEGGDRRFKFHAVSFSCGQNHTVQPLDSQPGRHLRSCQVDHPPTSWWYDINGYDQGFLFECPPGQALTGLASRHHNYYEDRIWSMGCAEVRGAKVGWCGWSWKTSYDQAWTLGQDRQIITGVFSAHHNYYEDRWWRVKSCNVVGTKGSQFHPGGYLNDWDEDLHYRASSDRFISQISSYHHNYYEDRKFKFHAVSFTC